MQFDIRAPLLPDMVRLHGKWYPYKSAIIDEHKSLSWGEIDLHSNQVANGLRAQGIGKGDSVAILMTNVAEYVEIMFGIFKAGAVVVPLNLAVNEDGLLNMLEDASARAVFFTPEQYARLEESLAALDTLGSPGLLVYGDAVAAPAQNYLQWRNRQSGEDPAVVIDDDDPCNIIYSSGTTGLPKGIKHIHRRRVQSMYELALAHRYHFGTISICPIGLYSNIAWASVFCALIVGATCVIRKGFEAVDWIDTVEKYGVTHTMMVPLMFQKVLEAPNFSRAAVTSLEAVISGGSPLFEGLKKQATEELGCAVIELYGLTEGFMTTLQPEEAEGKLSSVGKPVRGHDYILLDDADNELGWDNTGEICARSVHWMLEYHNRPEATAEAMYVDKQGLQWLRTGDIGRTDSDGFLFIVDRKKDMILSGGQNIYPADIEAVMVEHPLVAEATVIGVPHEKWGETPLALIVAREAVDNAMLEELLQWVNERVGKRQRISAIEARETLPRNPNGKVLKRELRKEFQDKG